MQLRAANNRAIFRSDLLTSCHRLHDCNRGRNDCAQHQESGDHDFSESAAFVFRRNDQIVGKFPRVHNKVGAYPYAQAMPTKFLAYKSLLTWVLLLNASIVANSVNSALGKLQSQKRNDKSLRNGERLRSELCKILDN